jgi:hypothetical protein
MSDDDIPLYAMYGANHFAMDKAFCARMRAAIKAGLESAPPVLSPRSGPKIQNTSQQSPGRRSHL